MQEFKKIIIIVTIILSTLYVYSTLNISFEHRNGEDNLNILNHSVLENSTEISNVNSDYKVFISLANNLNITVLDIHRYDLKFMNNSYKYLASNDGLFFTVENTVIQSLYNFIYSRERSKILFCKEGYLYLEKFTIDKVPYFYIKIRKRGVMSFRGLLLNFDETQKFADTLESIEI